jgi:hypothetical protein
MGEAGRGGGRALVVGGGAFFWRGDQRARGDPSSRVRGESVHSAQWQGSNGVRSPSRGGWSPSRPRSPLRWTASAQAQGLSQPRDAALAASAQAGLGGYQVGEGAGEVGVVAGMPVKQVGNHLEPERIGEESFAARDLDTAFHLEAPPPLCLRKGVARGWGGDDGKPDQSTQ